MHTKHLAAPFLVKELGAGGLVAGYASVFGEVDAQREIVARGAFRRSLGLLGKNRNRPAMLWMHEPAQPVGVWNRAEEDARGLYVEGQLAIKTQAGADAYELLRLGAVTGLSIGYRTVASKMDSKTGIRTLTDVDLYEISLVTFPANPSARIETVKTPFAHAAENSLATNAKNSDDMRAIVMRLRSLARALSKPSS